MVEKEKELIKTFSVRCPKCNKVYDDRNETNFKTSNLPIILYSMKRIVFECINCKHHIPVLFVSAFNIVHLYTHENLIGENKNIKKECIVCGKKEDLNKIKRSNSQYDGSWICKGCIETNQDVYEDILRNRAIRNSFGG